MLAFHPSEVPGEEELVGQLVHAGEVVDALPGLEALDELACADQVDPHDVVVCLVVRGDCVAKVFGHVFHDLVLAVFHIDNDRFILIFLLFLILLLLGLIAPFGHLRALFLIFQLLNPAHHTLDLLRLSLLRVLTLIA